MTEIYVDESMNYSAALVASKLFSPTFRTLVFNLLDLKMREDTENIYINFFAKQIDAQIE